MEYPRIPTTVVKCSVPGCSHEAVSKVAAPWREGSHSELKTYGYTCSSHFEAMTEYARRRPRALHLAAAESVGSISTYPLAGS